MNGTKMTEDRKLVKKTFIITATAAILLLSMSACFFARDILLLSFLSLLIAVAMSYPVALFSKIMPRGAATFLTLLGLIAAGIGLGSILVPKIIEEGRLAMDSFAEASTRLQSWYQHMKNTGAGPMGSLPDAQTLASRFRAQFSHSLGAGAAAILPAAKGGIAIFSSLFFIFVLAAFLVYQKDTYRNGLKSLFPAPHHRTFETTYDHLSIGLRQWLRGILIGMTLMGTFAAIGLKIAGIHNWMLLGLLTFLGTFIPYVGAILSAIPGLLIGLSQDSKHFFAALIVYILVHILEGYIVEPIVMKRAVHLRPAILLFGQALLAELFGVMGIIIAAPMLVCIQILVKDLYVNRALHNEKMLKKVA